MTYFPSHEYSVVTEWLVLIKTGSHFITHRRKKIQTTHISIDANRRKSFKAKMRNNISKDRQGG